MTSAKVAIQVKKELRLPEDTTDHYWTDSQIVLGYLNNAARRFHIYVANRVQIMHDLTEVQNWHHVGTKSNPADHASRGLNAEGLKDSNWLTGPNFLWEQREYLPANCTVTEEDPEVRTIRATNQQEFDLEACFSRLGTWEGQVSVVSFFEEGLYAAERVYLRSALWKHA